MGTLVRSTGLCGSLFVLMAAVFVRPEIVQEPGLAQLAATGLVLAATVGLTFSVQARFASSLLVDIAARVVLAGFALIALAHPDPWVAAAACSPVAGFAGYWLLRRRLHQLDAYRSLRRLPHARKHEKEIRSPENLEIGDMAAQAKRVGLPDAERQRLGWFRRVRDALAHDEVVSRETSTSPIAIRIIDVRE